jgi:hypothetical protein
MPDEKKIIIDEDWKSQVQAEKEAAAKGKPAAAPAGEAREAEAGDVPMPSATFELLLTTLATEALVALGQVPHPATGEMHVHRNQGQYLIDMIDVLRSKTKGNLSPDEQELIDSLLHQLRMVFIATADRPASASDAAKPPQR